MLVVIAGREFGHQHPQVTLHAEEDRVELRAGTVRCPVGSGKPERRLRLVDIAVGSGPRRVLRDAPAIEQAGRAVITGARVDVHAAITAFEAIGTSGRVMPARLARVGGHLDADGGEGHLVFHHLSLYDHDDLALRARLPDGR